MTYWEQCEERHKPLSLTLWKRLAGQVSFEEAQEMVRAIFVRCAKYADLPENQRHKLLNRAMVTESRMWYRHHAVVLKHHEKPLGWGQERTVCDNYCFLLHELRQAMTPELPYRVAQLFMYGYEANDVKPILFLSHGQFTMAKETLKPYLSHVLHG